MNLRLVRMPLSSTAALAVILLLSIIVLKVFDWYRGDTIASPPVSLSHEQLDLSVATATPRYTNWREELIARGIISSSSPETATSSDPLAYLGDILSTEVLRGYTSLKESNSYSTELARKYGSSIGENVLPEPLVDPIDPSTIQISENTSAEAVLLYRSEMRTASAPLISDIPPEITLFAEYLDTKNPERLRLIEKSAANYRKTSTNMQALTVPFDALTYHVRIVDALERYANTLDRLVLFSDDALATIALLRTYNEAERELLLSFDALAQYYVRKSGE